MAADLIRRDTPAAAEVEPRTLQRATATTGLWAALLAATLTVIFAVLTAVSPAAEWAGIEAYARGFASIQVTQLIPILLLAPAVVLLMTCIHHLAPETKRVFSHVALILSAVYAATIATNYILQLFVVRLNVLAGELDGIALLAMANPRSAFVALETAGYGWFSLMALFAAAVFAGERLERWLRALFALTGLTGIGGAVAALADQRLVSLTGFGLSLVAFLAASVLLVVYFARLRGSAQ